MIKKHLINYLFLAIVFKKTFFSVNYNKGNLFTFLENFNR